VSRLFACRVKNAPHACTGLPFASAGTRQAARGATARGPRTWSHRAAKKSRGASNNENL